MKTTSKVKQRLIALLGMGLLAASGVFADPPDSAGGSAVRRFGLFIGSNNGGRDRIMLRYAVSDAQAVSRVFGDMGGIAGEDNILVVEPNLRELNRQITNLAARISGAKQNYRRTELVFYYSGHSDEEGLLLGRERYQYAELRRNINQIPSDMRIVILDSCSSGSFTRAKGGTKTQPFLIDTSLSAEGYAFLTSSSATETSQESDSIESSYFTHSLVAGLRGAADTVGDRRVTLNEVYHFAYAETLAKTETSAYGAQHPSYDMQISGTGDVVLTDIRETSASLLFAEEVTGRLSIRDSSDYLIAEITKVSQKPMELGLEPGPYRITLQRGDNFYRAEVFLAEGRQTPVAQSDFRLISAAPGTARGGSGDDAWADDIRREAERHAPAETAPETGGASTGGGDDEGVNILNFQFVPGENILAGQKATDNILSGFFLATGRNLQGIGFAPIGITNTGYVQGVQTSGIFNRAGTKLTGIQQAGIFNTVGGSLEGMQAAGIFNTVGGSVGGMQTAGIFNTVGGTVNGTQAAGIFNGAGSVEGVQTAGIFNLARGAVSGLQAGLINVAGEAAGSGKPAAVTVQAGLVNISRNENTVPLGIVNIVKNGLIHPAVYYDSNNFMNFSFRSGSKYFYSIVSVGTQRITTADNLFVNRGGFGAELPLGKFFLNLDILGGSVIHPDGWAAANQVSRPGPGKDRDSEEWKRYYQEIGKINRATITHLVEVRLSAGCKVFEHLGAFAGLSYTGLFPESDTAPRPPSAWLGHTWDNGSAIHQIGVFAGLQF